ncbi:putative lipase 1 [Halenospora varia]|nr:putative lipase 1 [Halenospora varia]
MKLLATLLTLAPIVLAQEVNSALGTWAGLSDFQRGVEAFCGIPYAQPPSGSRRLQPPQPINTRFVFFDGTQPSPKCIGIENYVLRNGSEDCLTLDIVSPKGQYPALPVYAFIHGGEFNGGDKSDVVGSALVIEAKKQGMPFIFVSINHRLSFLGFPSGAEASHHGAYTLGLLDQRMALQWIQDNIHSFGGDPNKVVLGGQASGADAVAVAYQLLAYGGKGSNALFRGMFFESGAATSLTPIPCPNYTAWQDHYGQIVKITGYAPVIDGKFMEDYPSVLLSNSKFDAMPALIGHTTDELIGRIPINQNFDNDTIILSFSQAFLSYVPQSTIKAQLALYPATDSYPDVGPPGSGSQWGRLVAIDNDLQSFYPVWEAAMSISRYPWAKVYKYCWNARHSTTTAPDFFRVNQGQDLPFLFNNPTSASSSDETALSLSYKRYVAAFINYLNPNQLSPPQPL